VGLLVLTDWPLLVLGPRRALAIVEVVGLMIGKAKGAPRDLQATGGQRSCPQEEIQELKRITFCGLKQSKR